MASALQAQLSSTASKKLGEHQSSVSVLSFTPRRSPLLEGSRHTRRRHSSLAMLVTAKMDMRVMVKLSVAKSSGKLDLSDCGLTEVPPEVCDLRDLEASTAAH